MGAWGTTLYSNDLTSDIRADYIEKLRKGKLNIEATTELIDSYTGIMGDPEEECLFWFALADTQWDYGRLLPDVKDKALFFLSQDDELMRWSESDVGLFQEWVKTRQSLLTKLQSPQPPEKSIRKHKLYQCKWKLGDVFSYKFTSEYSNQKGMKGQYFLFRKVSEDELWPGHKVPVINIYNWIGDSIPSIDELSNLKLLPIYYYLYLISKNPSRVYNITLLNSSDRTIPKDNLTYLGNIQGGDLIPFCGWKNYYAIGWETSKYNNKIEHFVIDMFLTYNERG